MDDKTKERLREELFYKDCVKLPEGLNDHFFNALDDKDAQTVLQILEQNPEAARARDYPSDINSTRVSEEFRSRALDVAAAKMPADVIQKMIDLGADPAAEGTYGSLCLHIAALNNRTDVIDLLLDCGANIEAPNNDHETPFHRAIVAGRLEAAKHLLARGACWNKSPDDLLHLFLMRNHQGLGFNVDFREVTSFLVEDHGANPNGSKMFLQRDLYSPPLHTAISRQWKLCLDAVQALLECGADPNTRDSDGNTPLHHMALSCRIREYNFPVIALLLERGANPLLRNNDNKTVADLCHQHNKGMLEWAGDMIAQKERDIIAKTAARTMHEGTKKPLRLLPKIGRGR